MSKGHSRMGKPVNELHRKKRIFASAYLRTFRGDLAAIEAGYCEKSATKAGWKLLHDPQVRKMLGEISERRLARMEIKAEDVLEEVRRIAFANVLDFTDADGRVDFGKLERERAAAVGEVTSYQNRQGAFVQKVKLLDKLRALEILGRHLKLFVDARLEVPGLESLADAIARGRKAIAAS